MMPIPLLLCALSLALSQGATPGRTVQPLLTEAPLYEPLGNLDPLPETRLSPPFAFSPDPAPLIALTRRSLKEPRSELVLTDISGATPRTLYTQAEEEFLSLCWSPDGKRLALVTKPLSPMVFPKGMPYRLHLFDIESGQHWNLESLAVERVRWGNDSRSLHFWTRHAPLQTEPPSWRLMRLSAPWENPVRTPLDRFQTSLAALSAPPEGALSPGAKFLTTWETKPAANDTLVLNLVLENLETGERKTVLWRRFDDAGEFRPYRIEFAWSEDLKWLYMVYQGLYERRPMHYAFERETGKFTALNPLITAQLSTGSAFLLPTRHWIKARGYQLLCIPANSRFPRTPRDRLDPFWLACTPATGKFLTQIGLPASPGVSVISVNGKYLLFQPEDSPKVALYKISLRYLFHPIQMRPESGKTKRQK